VHPTVIIATITSILHPLWCYLFTNLTNLNFYGAAIAKTITSLLNSTMLINYWYMFNVFKWP